MMIRHIIASGCSFTADGIGGLPPSLTHPNGGCSFVNDLNYQASIPKTWVGHVAKELKIDSLVNLAASSHGNIMIANNIMSLLSQFPYDPETTIILFNISDPARLDLMCSWEHPNKCNYCDWSQDILPYTYIKRDSEPVNYVSKNIGIEQIEILSSNAILGMMSYLEKNKFNFKFLLMSDYRSHTHLGPIIKKFQSRMIELGSHAGMKEFVANVGLNTKDQFHPDSEGHQRIAEVVLKTLSKEL